MTHCFSTTYEVKIFAVGAQSCIYKPNQARLLSITMSNYAEIITPVDFLSYS